MFTCHGADVVADSGIYCTGQRRAVMPRHFHYDAARANKLSVNGDDRNDQQPMTATK